MVSHRGLVACTRIRHVTDQLPRGDENENDVTVHYWAAARAAAGIAEEHVDASTLAELLVEIHRRHGHRDRFDDVIAFCSILVGETPVGAKEPAEVRLPAGTNVEFLPPFAGG
jgi:molybdopterin converting factor small subunit